MSVQVFVDDSQARADIQRLSDAVTPTVFANIFDDPMTEFLQRRVRNRFQTLGDAASGKWEKNKPSTTKTKRRRGLRLKTNIATGQMYDYLTRGTFRTSTISLGSLQFEFPSEDPSEHNELAIILAQMGAKPRRSLFGPVGGQPPRPVLAFGTYDEQNIVRIAADAIERYLR